MSNLNDEELLNAAMGDLDGKPSPSDSEPQQYSQPPAMPNKNLIRCNLCNQIIDTDTNFCSNCGAKIGSEPYIHKNNAKKSFDATVNKVKPNDFVTSVKQDINNSQTIHNIKDKAGAIGPEQKKKLRIIGIVIFVFIILLIIVTHIHQCDECDKVYFGNKHTVTYWGETENWCNECYDEYF